MTSNDLLPLFRHMEWADARLWRAALALPADAGADSLRELLTHVHVVQRAFLQLWRNAPVTAMADAEGLADLPSVLAWARPYYADASAAIGGMSLADLDRELVPPWAKYFVPDGQTPGASTVAETALQVWSHTTHHRAQLATRVRAMGGDPPITDFIGWMWHGRPDADWSWTGS